MFKIREATPEDNEALLRLEAESPQGTGISILIDRDDYFYRSRVYDHTKILVAEERGKLVGVMAYAIKDVYLNGETDRVAYFYDLRGEASYRRSMKRGLLRLWRSVLDDMEAEGAAFLYGHVKGDNYDSLNVCTRMNAQIVASFDILSLPSLAGRPVDLDPHLSTLEAEVSRLETLIGQRSMRPVDLKAPYFRGAELGHLRGLYRLEQGDSLAQVSAWDLSAIYRGRVVHLPASLRLLGAFLNPLSRYAPVPRIPKTGEQLTYLHLFDPVCHGERGSALLKQLLQRVRRSAHADGIDVLLLFAYRDDPLSARPRFFPQKVMHYHTLVRPLTSERLPTPPLYLDIRDL
jgi:hypothetical protein